MSKSILVDEIRYKSNSIERLFVPFFLISLTIPLSQTIFMPWLRIYFFDLFLFPILLLWYMRITASGIWKINLRAVDVLLLCLLLWFFVCDLIAPRHDITFERWLLWLRGVFIYFYFSRNFFRCISINMFIKVLAFIVVCESIICIIQMITQSNFGSINQYFGKSNQIVSSFVYNKEMISRDLYNKYRYVRVHGTFFHTGIIAEWMVLISPMLLSWYLKSTTNKKNIFYLIVWLMGIISAIFTFSRTEWSSIGIGVILVLLWWRKLKVHKFIFYGKLDKKLISIGCIALCAILFIIIIFWYANILDIYLFRALDFNDRFLKKFSQINASWQIMLWYPIFGVGQGNFGLYLHDTTFDYFYRGHGVVHNILFLIGAESGFIGVVLFIWLLIIAVWKNLKYIRISPVTEFDIIKGAAVIAIICMTWNMQWSDGIKHHSLLPIYFVFLGIAVLNYIQWSTNG